MGKIIKNGRVYAGSGSAVTVTQVLSSGTKIAEIDVDGQTTDLYAPEGGGSGGEFVNPVLVNRANLYSTSERIIGQWIDGKPIYQIVRDTPFSDVSLIPTMSSNTSDVCEVSANGYYQDNYSYKAFDNDDSTYWASYTNNYGYLDVHFFTAQTVVKINLKPKMRSTTSAVKDFEIWGSNDNFATHDMLLSATCQNSSDAQNFDLTTTGSYNYYRLNILNAWTTSDISVGAVQLNLIGEGQSSITILDTRIVNGTYIYQYIKNTDTAQAIAVSDDYSTNEAIVGHWIDGKPLYQKTITGTTSSVSGDYHSVDVSDLDIEYLVKYAGFVRGYDATVGRYFDYYIGTNGASVDNNVKEESYCWYRVTQKQIVIAVRSSQNQLSRPFYLTIQYTKTTD